MMQDQEVGLPVRAGLAPTGLYLALRQIGRDELQDAFMQETVARVPAQERIVHVARDGSSAARDTAPAGIVFHVARCGSTLISQSLKRLDNLVVYAEPQPVNEILAPPHQWPRGDLVAALRTLGSAFARHAAGPYVLKLSSWNTLYCDIVAEAFPETPWVLSVRDPVEVGVSLLASPPGWFQGTAEAARGLVKQVDPGHAARSPEEFVARAYGAFCAAAARLDVAAGGSCHTSHCPRQCGTSSRRISRCRSMRRNATQSPRQRGGKQRLPSARRRNSRPTWLRNRKPRHRPFVGQSIRWRARNSSASGNGMRIQCEGEYFDP